MVKDKVLQIENGNNYYVLETVDYNGKKYALSLECDLNSDTVNENDYFVMELDMVDGELAIKHIEDDKIADIVIQMLLEKVGKN